MYIRYDATPEQRANLLKLSNYMWSLPEGYDKLDMGYYLSRETDSPSAPPSCATSVLRYKCGTTACFLGHGPSAGIKSRSGWCWDHYAYRRFAATFMGINDVWDFLFSPEWLNDTKQCAMRGWLMLRGHAMEDYSYNDSLHPKVFADEIAAA